MNKALCVAATIIAFFLPVEVMANSPQERAVAIKTWRAQCNDPDPDLRLAYLEAALETNDNTIIRTCARLALNSDNSDLRNLGLRAILASKEQINFEVTQPIEITKAIEDAGDDEDKLREIGNWYTSRAYRKIRNGMTYIVEKAKTSSSSAHWTAIGGRSSAHKDFRGKAIIVGDRVTWTGKAELDSYQNCQLNVVLGSGAKLSGSLICDNLHSFPVHVDLM